MLKLATTKTYAAQFNADEGAGIRMGWPTLDEMTGGLSPGDSVGIVGKKGLGKTWQMLYGCHYGWKHQGLCQMFVSMEMPPLQIEQRLVHRFRGTNQLHRIPKGRRHVVVRPGTQA